MVTLYQKRKVGYVGLQSLMGLYTCNICLTTCLKTHYNHIFTGGFGFSDWVVTMTIDIRLDLVVCVYDK